MSTNIGIVTVIVAAPTAITISWPLSMAIRDTDHPHPDIGPPAGYEPEIKAEAARLVAKLQPLAQAVDRQTLRRWLLPIAAAVRNPPETSGIDGWIAAVELACGQLPGAVFTPDSQREALQTFKFFPSAADVYEIVASDAAKIRDTLTTLKRIAAARSAA